MNTQFTVRDPSSTPWDTSTFPVDATCHAESGTTVAGVTTYPGYSGSLFNVLDQYTSGTTKRSTYNAVIADGFRRWTTLCTIANPVVGDYLVQVKTNGITAATDNADAGNRFAIRAYGSASGDSAFLSIAGRQSMGIYSNKPGVTTEFHLARVPTTAAGQILNVRLFDVGDSNQSGAISIVYPPGAVGGPFTGCVGAGPASGTLSNCSFNVIWNGSSSDHQGKWQTVSVPIPANYSCTDSDYTQCWVRLDYVYGSGSTPTDVTSWTASIQGDPVRLVQ